MTSVSVSLRILSAFCCAVFLSQPAQASNCESASHSPRPKIALVIDDIGNSWQRDRQLIELPVPLTLAVLPFTPHGPRLASLAHQQGKQVILHLPMEADSQSNLLGPGALLASLSEREMKRRFIAAIESVPFVSGFNNHMGSLLTRDSAIMFNILSEAKNRQLLFLDSRTSARTQALKVARELAVPATKRDVFLDAAADESSMRTQWARALAIAQRQGFAVVIAHPKKTSMRLLPELVTSCGVEFVRLDQLLRTVSDQAETPAPLEKRIDSLLYELF